MLGSLDGGDVFVPYANQSYSGRERMYDLSPSFYASKTFRDASREDRRILWGWLVMFSTYGDSAWAGVQSLPRVVELDADRAALKTYPVPALDELRTNHSAKESASVPPNSTLVWDADARFLDIVVRFDGNSSACGLRVQ